MWNIYAADKHESLSCYRKNTNDVWMEIEKKFAIAISKHVVKRRCCRV